MSRVWVQALEFGQSSKILLVHHLTCLGNVCVYIHIHIYIYAGGGMVFDSYGRGPFSTPQEKWFNLR